MAKTDGRVIYWLSIITDTRMSRNAHRMNNVTDGHLKCTYIRGFHSLDFDLYSLTVADLLFRRLRAVPIKIIFIHYA